LFAMMKRREESHPVSPTYISGKLRDRHALKHGDAEVSDTGEFADSGQNCALWREGANMQFINNLSFDRYVRPFTLTVAPLLGRRIDGLRGPMGAFRLVTGCRIRKPFATVDREPVTVAYRGRGNRT
jgi:hypothetical protein